MYLPSHFEVKEREPLLALIEANPLATWVMPTPDEPLQANHIPFLLDRSRGEQGLLIGHVARANPVWKACTGEAEALLVFQDSQAYISPNWYPSKAEHGKAVPTWNYAVVHVHGRPRAIEDKTALLEIVTRLTRRHESAQPQPWDVTDAPIDYIDKLLGAIVGIEIPIERLQGKWKVSQNRSAEDRAGLSAALRHSGGDEAKQMADWSDRPPA
ncbi:FMN-binding negative transcriptional regulator [Pelomonas sp. SE-A7]|uniref:FMN-binding negative transcriptional regulator n=1 Tax=Pelomonas sp. SE-A7 TaxID=3054953 RepID=UPI00259CACDC|nr:FMN-binding negative transcriptional regulator [Pelomonas sp. SE-A7]MDM4766595.1 FMN-binding negative transcriptional regulator [Pelomonas sp. SE-A7]